MKRILSVFLITACAAAMLFQYSVSADALDEIQNYEITVDMRSDGTMDMAYHLEWKVLDDSSEGPLDWVKIGVANQYVDEIEAVSDNISSVGFMGDGGAYIRVDLDRSYYAGEIVTFDFKIHQSYMYTLDYDANLCSYDFEPGWFDEIDVKSMTIRWEKENVLDSDAQDSDEYYLIWNSSLAAGSHYPIHVSYTMGVFETSDDMQYTPYTEESDSGATAAFVIFFILVVVIIIIFTVIRYGGGGGDYGGFGTHHAVHHGGGFHSCACVSSCACACACACAGGGRAGCSAKNFYGSSVQTEKLRHALEPKKDKTV